LLGAAATRSLAADDFTVFRSVPVAQGTGVTSATGEPSVANDRNALLFTGNWHAAISGDNGLSWSFLNPSTQFPAADGGFCCDQIAYAVDRGPESLVFWLLQYANDGATNPTDGANGRVRLVVYQGRDELLDQADFCQIDFKPSDFGFPNNTWFDFNQMSNTQGFLYISSKAMLNLGDTDNPPDGRPNSTFLSGVVWRIALDDLDSDDCTPPVTAWSGPGTGFNPSLVQGADTGTTMHWASHGSTTSEIVVTRMEDSSTTGFVYTKSISPYLNTERPPATRQLNGTCALPDGTDPCNRINDAINIGYTDGPTVGWFWNVRQGNGFPFPHVRGARFAVSPTPQFAPTLIQEPDIWNSDHAFFYPTLGVNSRGHVGITVYRAGGGKFISARAALVDDVTSSWTSLSLNGLVTSDSGVVPNTWGDYQSVRKYGNCTGTFAASVHSMQGGTANGNAEHRFAWFGREDEGCADLAVVSLAAYRAELDQGESILIGQTTRNIGSGTAGAETRTRYYLSRNASKSDDDLRLGDPTIVPAIGRGVSHGDLASPTVPAGADGTYYVIACADDTNKASEITDTNNCAVAPQTVTVVREFVNTVSNPVAVATSGPAQWVPASTARLSVTVRRPLRPAASQLVSLHLSPTGRTAGARRIATIPVRIGSARRGRLTLRPRIRVPKGITRRRQFVLACAGPRAAPSRCIATRSPIYVKGVRRR
jgi:CARDB